MGLLGKFRALPLSEKMLLFLVAAACVCVAISTVLVEATHGGLSENGNRYGHAFSFSSFCWSRMALMAAAYVALLCPWWKYCMGGKVHRCWGIFPARALKGKILSLSLTVLGAATGVGYTALLLVYNYVLYTERRIMLAGEVEAEYFAMAGCALFWGIVDLSYRRKWK